MMARMIAIIECLCHVAIELAGYEMEGWFVVSGNLLLVVRSKAFTMIALLAAWNACDPRNTFCVIHPFPACDEMC